MLVFRVILVALWCYKTKGRGPKLASSRLVTNAPSLVSRASTLASPTFWTGSTPTLFEKYYLTHDRFRRTKKENKNKKFFLFSFSPPIVKLIILISFLYYWMTRHKTNKNKNSSCQAMCVKQNLATRWIVSKNKTNSAAQTKKNSLPNFLIWKISICAFLREMIEIGLRSKQNKRDKNFNWLYMADHCVCTSPYFFCVLPLPSHALNSFYDSRTDEELRRPTCSFYTGQPKRKQNKQKKKRKEMCVLKWKQAGIHSLIYSYK